MLSTLKIDDLKGLVRYTVFRKESARHFREILGYIVITFDSLQSEVNFLGNATFGMDDLVYITRQMELLHQDWQIRTGRIPLVK